MVSIGLNSIEPLQSILRFYLNFDLNFYVKSIEFRDSESENSIFHYVYIFKLFGPRPDFRSRGTFGHNSLDRPGPFLIFCIRPDMVISPII